MRASRRRRLVGGTVLVSVIMLALGVIVLQLCCKVGSGNADIETFF